MEPITQPDILTALLEGLFNGSLGAYFTAFLLVLGGLVTAASAIVPFTKTKKDDEIVGWVQRLLVRLSVIKPGK